MHIFTIHSLLNSFLEYLFKHAPLPHYESISCDHNSKKKMVDLLQKKNVLFSNCMDSNPVKRVEQSIWMKWHAKPCTDLQKNTRNRQNRLKMFATGTAIKQLPTSSSLTNLHMSVMDIEMFVLSQHLSTRSRTWSRPVRHGWACYHSRSGRCCSFLPPWTPVVREEM